MLKNNIAGLKCELFKDKECYSYAYMVTKDFRKYYPYTIEPMKIDEVRVFSNGFKAVALEDGKFGYVRESDNKLLDYRYDVALDFNEYGLAMAGNDGKVGWIDQNFQFLEFDFLGKVVEVGKFSGKNELLSRIVIEVADKNFAIYMRIDGSIKQFRYFIGEKNNDILPTFAIEGGDNFDEDGYAFYSGGVLIDMGVAIDRSAFTSVYFDIKDRKYKS